MTPNRLVSRLGSPECHPKNFEKNSSNGPASVNLQVAQGCTKEVYFNKFADTDFDVPKSVPLAECTQTLSSFYESKVTPELETRVNNNQLTGCLD